MSKINYQTLLDENARLRAERDALREGEMGNATHSNTRAAADIYFQLVEECQIPPGGSLVQYVFELQEKAQAVPEERRELVMWIKRLAHSLSHAKPESELPDEAKEYLKRKGLVSVEDALRRQSPKNACRAVMLNGTLTNEDTIKIDGWIKCDEHMPKKSGAYWCWFGNEKPSVIQQRVCMFNARHNEWCDSSVTHWMPLPVAPTPEGEPSSDKS